MTATGSLGKTRRALRHREEVAGEAEQTQVVPESGRDMAELRQAAEVVDLRVA